MTDQDVVLATPDAKLLRYIRTLDDLTLEVEQTRPSSASMCRA